MPSTIFAALICLFSCCSLSPILAQGTTSTGTNAPVKVQTITVHEEQINSKVEVVGTVQAVDRAVIAAKITGTIVELPVVLGSRVTKGDLLVKIAAEEISARVLQAQAQLTQAKRNLNREEKLLKQHASTPETVKSMRDMLAIARAGYKEAVSIMDFTTITAPFSGVITKKIAHNGDLATPGVPLLSLENDRQLQVVASIPATIASRIQQHQLLQVHIPTAKTTIEGAVAEISPVIDPVSRTLPIKINLTSTTGLRTGMFARIELPGTKAVTLMVPEQAVIPFGQLQKIFVVKKNTARLRLVRTGIHEKGRIEILSGLAAGEQIVTGNNRHLISGQRLLTNN
ncbi:MAG TPA: efflux RND transporter periplasmic adaptor subunit [Desulfobulbus sp.]|nr:efflux RND transporter periplasmic adaptor subunit [Desulfobulbus sp.]HHD63699.1 efflux RND transporter periplasmic adaptor subunit [Desulfobulbaceae bacterium]